MNYVDQIGEEIIRLKKELEDYRNKYNNVYDTDTTVFTKQLKELVHKTSTYNHKCVLYAELTLGILIT